MLIKGLELDKKGREVFNCFITPKDLELIMETLLDLRGKLPKCLASQSLRESINNNVREINWKLNKYKK
ncbi:MAG: hypothetical protein WCX46_04190 [Candidatus Paceibacterota bacterium]